MDRRQSPRLLVCVGSYTEPVPHGPGAHGKGLQIFELDLETGEAVPVFADDAMANPAFLCVHPTLPVLYVVTESWTVPGTVSSLGFSADYARLLSRTQLPSLGRIPSYVCVVGSWLLLSNYGDGSLLSYRLRPDGQLDEQVSKVQLCGRGPDPARQDGPHPHCILPHPVNGSLYAADLGADMVMRVTLDQGSGALDVVDEVRVPAGSGPRHLAFTPSGDTLFLVEELTSTLAVFAIGPDAELTLNQRLSMLPAESTVTNCAADLVVMPGAAQVFASNRGDDSIVAFQPRPDGSWRARAWTPTGDVPRGLALTPDGAHLLVASQDSDLVEVFAVTDEGLTPVMALPTATPTCIRCLTPR